MGTERTKSLALLIIWGNSIFNVMSIQKFRQVSPRFEELPLTTVLSNYLRTKVAIYNEKFLHILPNTSVCSTFPRSSDKHCAVFWVNYSSVYEMAENWIWTSFRLVTSPKSSKTTRIARGFRYSLLHLHLKFNLVKTAMKNSNIGTFAFTDASNLSDLICVLK